MMCCSCLHPSLSVGWRTPAWPSSHPVCWPAIDLSLTSLYTRSATAGLETSSLTPAGVISGWTRASPCMLSAEFAGRFMVCYTLFDYLSISLIKNSLKSNISFLGEAYTCLEAATGKALLRQHMDNTGEDHPLNKLRVKIEPGRTTRVLLRKKVAVSHNLVCKELVWPPLCFFFAGVDPDDTYNETPYEKGFCFVSYLAHLAGDQSRFDAFLKVTWTIILQKLFIVIFIVVVLGVNGL